MPVGDGGEVRVYAKHFAADPCVHVPRLARPALQTPLLLALSLLPPLHNRPSNQLSNHDASVFLLLTNDAIVIVTRPP